MSFPLQLVTVLVTAALPGAGSTQQDNNPSQQRPFVHNGAAVGAAWGGLAGAGTMALSGPGHACGTRAPAGRGSPRPQLRDTPGEPRSRRELSVSRAASTQLHGCHNFGKQAFPWHETEGPLERAEKVLRLFKAIWKVPRHEARPERCCSSYLSPLYFTCQEFCRTQRT